MIEDIIKISALVIAIAMIAVATWYWVRTLVEISRSDMDPKERRKWWIRVFLLRFIGVIWYLDHMKKKQQSDRVIQ